MSDLGKEQRIMLRAELEASAWDWAEVIPKKKNKNSFGRRGNEKGVHTEAAGLGPKKTRKGRKGIVLERQHARRTNHTGMREKWLRKRSASSVRQKR